MTQTTSYVPLSEPTPSPAALPSNLPSNPPVATATAAAPSGSSPLHSMKSIGNPFPKSLRRRCERASFVLSDFLSHSQEQAFINDDVIRNAKGLVFISMMKGGYIWSGRFGSGIVIAKTNQNTWSAPSAISCAGVGYGAQAGLEFTDYVIILKDEQALNAFSQTGNLNLGANLALAVGPWGRTGAIDLAVTCGVSYSLSKSRGLFGGVSLEATVLLENKKTNEKCYGKGVTVSQILSGEIPVNQEVSILHQALYQRFYANSSSPQPSSSPSPLPASKPAAPPSSFSSPSTSAAPAPASAPASAPSSPYPAAPSIYPPPYQSDGSDHERTDDKAGLLSQN